jgi:uncharacterized protein YkwD
MGLMHRVTVSVFGAAVSVLMVLSPVSASAQPAWPTPRTAAAGDGSALQTLINQDRAANGGLPPLAWSSCLANIALQNAQRMAAQGAISHTNGPTLDLGCGIGSTSAGENVAYISSGINDAQVNTMYMNSAGHRANILGQYTFVATAWVVATDGSGYNAEEFLNAPALVPVQPPTAWDSMGGIAGSGPAAASWGSGRLDLFIRGQDGQLWHDAKNGANWAGWEPLGGIITSDPAAVSWGVNRIDVFARGQDLQLWHRSFDGASWSGWEPLGGILSSGPGVASWGTGRLDVVARGQDLQLWHRAFIGASWGPWEPLGGILSAAPTAASWAANRIDVFGRGQDAQLWHKWFDGTSWSDWEPLGGILASGPGAASSAGGRLDVFIAGQDRQLWHRWFSASGWSAWTPMGGLLTADPGAASQGGSTDVFVRGTDLAVWHTQVTG